MLPRFSIVVELENAEVTGGVNEAIESIQSLFASILNAPPNERRRVGEVIFVSTPGKDSSGSEKLKALLPKELGWVNVLGLEPRGAGYFEKKMVGAIRSSGDYVFFVDSDVIYSLDWFTQVANDLRAHPGSVLYGETFAKPACHKVNSYGLTWQFPFRDLVGRDGRQIAHEWANSWIVPREVLQKIPIPRVPGSLKLEGVLWKVAAAKAGIPVVHSKASAEHRSPQTFGEWFGHAWRSGRSRACRKRLGGQKLAPLRHMLREARATLKTFESVSTHIHEARDPVKIRPGFSYLLVVAKHFGVALGYFAESLGAKRTLRLDYEDLLSDSVSRP